MKELVLLYWGTILLVYLSQVYYPVATRLDGRHTGKHSFMWRKVDIFMVIVIAWMTCFSFLRDTYNDSLLSSKVQNKLHNEAPFQGAFCFENII